MVIHRFVPELNVPAAPTGGLIYGTACGIPPMIVQPSPILPDADDGGLALLQRLREVKERMDSPAFRKHGSRERMTCRECLSAFETWKAKMVHPSLKPKAPAVRAFRSWGSLRDHLISYHDYDRRVVPQ